MRVPFAAGALLLVLSVVAVEATSSQTLSPSAPATAQVDAPAAAAAADDAAAKHAKRTACLAEAKTRKLVGAEKSAYLKDCIDAQ